MVDARLITEPVRLTYVGVSEIYWVCRAQEFVRYFKVCKQLSDVLTAPET